MNKQQAARDGVAMRDMEGVGVCVSEAWSDILLWFWKVKDMPANNGADKVALLERGLIGGW